MRRWHHGNWGGRPPSFLQDHFFIRPNSSRKAYGFGRLLARYKSLLSRHIIAVFIADCLHLVENFVVRCTNGRGVVGHGQNPPFCDCW